MPKIKKISGDLVKLDTSNFEPSNIGLDIESNTAQKAFEKINSLELASNTKDGLMSKEDKVALSNVVSEPQVKLVTTGKIEIQNNQIGLPYEALGSILYNLAIVYEDLTTNIIMEVTAEISDSDNTKVIFDSSDNLNGMYAVVSYLRRII